MTVFQNVADRLSGFSVLNADMSKYTTFRMGGPADILIQPRNEEELLLSLELCKGGGVPYYIIGNGSNLLVRDKGIRGAVIRIAENFASVSIEGNAVRANTGVLLSALANLTLKNGLMGLEWAAGIPGTFGGALAMNAGAYGGEISSCVKSVRVLRGGEISDIKVKDGDFAYRFSRFAYPECIALAGTLELQPDDGGANERKLKYSAERKSKQPLSFPSAGSVFKRPEGYFAGALIESAGLKGYSIGGAQVSEKHAGFIINTGGATARDVLDLIDYVKARVLENSGVALEPEIKIIGEE